MKSYKIITIITVILLIAIISIASFLGIYKQKDYRVVNVVPKYLLGMEFNNSRIVNFEVDKSIQSTSIYDKDGNEVVEKEEGIEYTEENGYTTVENKVNSDDKLTQENFKTSKAILINRLIALGANQYIVKQNKENGNIQIEITDDSNTDKIISSLEQRGIFELADKDTNEVLLNNSNIKSCKVVYGQLETGTTVYLQIKFDKQGKQKLEEISKTYIETTTQTTDENGETQENKETKEVAILLDGQTLRTTYFGETITDGTLNIAIGSSKDSATLQEYAISASEIAIILNTGILPITYTVTDYVVSTSITSSEINIALYVAIAVLIIMFIYLIIKFKTKGILCVLLQIGYIALLLLALRYTNIKITIEGIVGIIIAILLNYMYIFKAFNNMQESFIKEITAKFALKLIPIYILAIIFTFSTVANISSLGMTLFWGILVMYLYNITLTQIITKTIED